MARREAWARSTLALPSGRTSSPGSRMRPTSGRRSKRTFAVQFAIAANYGEGIAQPTFFDLYGFFPGSFVGNPGLKPESSRGGENLAALFGRARLGGSVTYFRQRLKDEIATVFLPGFTSTAVNADGKSKRQGIELEGYYQPSEALRADGHLRLARCQRTGCRRRTGQGAAPAQA